MSEKVLAYGMSTNESGHLRANYVALGHCRYVYATDSLVFDGPCEIPVEEMLDLIRVGREGREKLGPDGYAVPSMSKPDPFACITIAEMERAP